MEPLERKAITSAVHPTDEDGVVEALVSVTGIKDNVNDIIHPGAYKDTLGKRKPKGVWSHNWETPVAKAKEVRELLPGDPDLPKTLPNGEKWPEEAGALYVKAEFNLKTNAGREAYENVKFFGEDGEWSIGYKVPRGAAERDSKGTRHIKSIELYEFSPVLFGAASNARTRMPSEMKALRSAFATDEEFKSALLEALELKDENPDEVVQGHSEVAASQDTPPSEEVVEGEDSPTDQELIGALGQEEVEEDSKALPTDEELIALLTDETDDTKVDTEARSESKTVTLTPVLLEVLQNAQSQIKSILDIALTIDSSEEKAAAEEIESKSVKDALNELTLGTFDSNTVDEIAVHVNNYLTAVTNKSDENVKAGSTNVLDLIEAALPNANAEEERQLKTLAKAIGDDVAEYGKPEDEEKAEPVEPEKKIVEISQAELDDLLRI